MHSLLCEGLTTRCKLVLTRCFGIYVFAFFALPTIFVPFYDTMQNVPPAAADTVIQKHFEEYIYCPSKMFLPNI